jgi:hypothetical protein
MVPTAAQTRGASPYLPWNLSPEIERLIERVMILADKPVLTRPLAAAAVLDALPVACEKDAALCQRVRYHLRGYMKDYGLGYLSAEVAAASKDLITLPNRHGMRADSSYELTAQAYWQLGDNILISGGVLAYQDEFVPTGSVISIGTEYLQVDIGFRDHWFSPMTGSSMLIGTESQTMPSITMSNYEPLTRWGFRYEVFLSEMSESRNIVFGAGTTTGKPRLAGVHVSIEPLPGWSLGINRILQYGGGARSKSFGDLIDAFFRPASFDNTGIGGNRDTEFGNQTASVTARYLNPGSLPFAVYFEYAGEDTSTSSNVRLGNVSLSAGIQFPNLFQGVDVTVEFSDWQNAWYVHGIYTDGLRHKGNVIGHWGGDQRVVNDGVGAMSFMARIGWQPRFGGWMESTYRQLANESYTAPTYQRAEFLELRYSRDWQDFRIGGNIDVGSDSFGKNYARIGTFVRF